MSLEKAFFVWPLIALAENLNQFQVICRLFHKGGAESQVRVGYSVVCFLIVYPCHRKAMTAYHCLPCNHGVNHHGIQTATVAPLDCPLLWGQVRMCHGMVVQDLRHHSSQKLIRSVQAGNGGSILIRPSLTPRFGYQDSSPLHKPCRDVVRITLFQHVPHGSLKEYCGLVEVLSPEATCAVSSWSFPAVKFLNNLTPDASVNGFHHVRRRFVRHPVSSVNQIGVLGIPLPFNPNHALPELENCIRRWVLNAISPTPRPLVQAWRTMPVVGGVNEGTPSRSLEVPKLSCPDSDFCLPCLERYFQLPQASVLSMQQPNVPPLSQSGPFPRLSPVDLSLQPADLLTEVVSHQPPSVSNLVASCRASKVLLYSVRDHLCTCVYKAVKSPQGLLPFLILLHNQVVHSFQQLLWHEDPLVGGFAPTATVSSLASLDCS